MRIVLCAAVAFIAVTPAFAADEEPGDGAEDAQSRVAPRVCTPAQAVVPPFNNTPEAMDQSRVAATILRGDAICRTSAVFPEKSLIEHGQEQPVLPEEAVDETEGEPASEQPA